MELIARCLFKRCEILYLLHQPYMLVIAGYCDQAISLQDTAVSAAKRNYCNSNKTCLETPLVNRRPLHRPHESHLKSHECTLSFTLGIGSTTSDEQALKNFTTRQIGDVGREDQPCATR